MKYLSRLASLLSGASLTLAVWEPVGSAWQWGLFALILLGGSEVASKDRGPSPHPADGSDLERHFREKFDYERTESRRDDGGSEFRVIRYL